MTRQIVICTLLAVLALPGAAAAQDRWTLADAVQRARERNPRVGSAAASEREADNAHALRQMERLLKADTTSSTALDLRRSVTRSARPRCG